MPGFNGTGPISQGAMTGRGRGYCASPGQNAPNSPMNALRGRSFGRPRLGMRFRRSRARFGRGFW